MFPFCSVLFFSLCPVQAKKSLGFPVSGIRKGKALLIVCHYKPKGSIQSLVSGKNDVQHPALVTTVHACYTIQDGFYHCQMNKEAVAAVASAIASELRRD